MNVGLVALSLAVQSLLLTVSATNTAFCSLKASSLFPGVEGNLELNTQADGKIKVTGNITGLAPGEHGFHVHEKGSTGDDCKEAGGHFNPTNKAHGLPTDAVRHVGDLGNIRAGDDKSASVDITDSVIRFDGEANIVGKAVVVHALNDKGSSKQPTGDAGERVACCVVTAGSPIYHANLTLSLITLLVAFLIIRHSH